MSWDANRFNESPWHAISRIATQSVIEAPITGYRFHATSFNFETHIGFSQEEYYFGRHGIEVNSADNLKQFNNYRLDPITEPSKRIFYRTSLVDATEQAGIVDRMNQAGYQLCEYLTVGVDTSVLLYVWKSLDCLPPQLKTSNQSSILDYNLFAAKLDGTALFFVDRWKRSQLFEASEYRMSYQLISEDWENVAQLDIPLVNESRLRQFSIDISNVAAGTYKFMAILYDTSTGYRQKWIGNDGYIPEMQMLAEIIIPEAKQVAQ